MQIRMPSWKTIKISLLVVVLLVYCITLQYGPRDCRFHSTNMISAAKPEAGLRDFCEQLNSVLKQFPGKVFEYDVKRGDTVNGIASRLGALEALVECLNPAIEDIDCIRPGDRLRLVSGELHIEVDVSENLLTVFLDEIPLKRYSVATGVGGGHASPTGHFKIKEIVWDPYDYRNSAPSNSLNNRFGKVWISLSIPEYGIHGTNDPNGIGLPTSNGCIRMFNDDIERVAKLVTVGTRVDIIRQSNSRIVERYQKIRSIVTKNAFTQHL